MSLEAIQEPESSGGEDEEEEDDEVEEPGHRYPLRDRARVTLQPTPPKDPSQHRTRYDSLRSTATWLCLGISS